MTQLKPIAKELQSMGRRGDTILAHINPYEAQVLKSMGGSGTINPRTGLREYGLFSFIGKIWRGFVNVVKRAAPLILPAIAIFAPTIIPTIGSWLLPAGASATALTAAGTAALTAGITAASGAKLSQVLTAAALGGLTPYIAPIVGSGINSLIPGGVSQGTQNILTSGALAGGLAAARGGSVKQILTAAASGAASSYLAGVIANAVNGITNSATTSKTVTDASAVAADAARLKDMGLGEQQIYDNLVKQGVSTGAAEYAARATIAGTNVVDVTTGIAEGYGASNVYSNGKSAAQNSFTLGNNTDQLQRLEDSTLIAQDAINLKAQGLGQQQIIDTLTANGVDAGVAKTAVTAAFTSGATLGSVASSLEFGTQYANTKLFVPDSAKNITIDSSGPTAQDAKFVAQAAKDLANQNISRAQIEQILVQEGVAPAVAKQAAYFAYSDVKTIEYIVNDTARTVGNNVFTPTEAPVTPTPPPSGGGQPSTPTPPPTTPAPPPTPSYAGDAQFIAEQAKSLAAQGLSANQITATLVQEGVNPTVAYSAGQYANVYNVNVLANELGLQFGSRFGDNMYVEPPVTTPVTPEPPPPVTPEPPEPVTPEPPPPVTPEPPPPVTPEPPPPVTPEPPPPVTPEPPPPVTPELDVSTRIQFFDDGSVLVTDSSGNVIGKIDATGVSPNLNLQIFDDGSVLITDSSGESLGGIDNTGDVFHINNQGVAVYDNGTRLDQTQINAPKIDINGVGGTPPTTPPTTPPSDYGDYPDDYNVDIRGSNPPPPEPEPPVVPPVIPEPPIDDIPHHDTEVPIDDTPTPPEEPVTPEPPVVEPPVIPPIITPPVTPTKPDPGSYVPAPADPRWSGELPLPGLNPGWMEKGVRPMYNTTSPVQSQYYWGNQRGFSDLADLQANYNKINNVPPPWGVHQGWWEQPRVNPNTYNQYMETIPVAPQGNLPGYYGTPNVDYTRIAQNYVPVVPTLPPISQYVLAKGQYYDAKGNPVAG